MPLLVQNGDAGSGMYGLKSHDGESTPCLFLFVSACHLRRMKNVKTKREMNKFGTNQISLKNDSVLPTIYIYVRGDC